MRKLLVLPCRLTSSGHVRHNPVHAVYRRNALRYSIHLSQKLIPERLQDCVIQQQRWRMQLTYFGTGRVDFPSAA